MKFGKRALSVALCLIIVIGAAVVGGKGFIGMLDLLAFKASAVYTGSCGDNLIWEYNYNTQTLTISGTGNMYNYAVFEDNNPPWYRNGIKYAVIEKGITGIGNYAFANCSNLTSIIIPDSVTSIGKNAFFWCTKLTSVTIGNSVTSIGNYAFENCTSLTSLTIPDSVTSIGYGAFEDCTGLTSVTIGKSVTSIGGFVFSSCTGLTSITIPDSVTSIGINVFENCKGLTAIIVDGNNTKFSSMQGILFNKDLTELIRFPIGKSATSYIIPDSIISIGFGAFEGCTSLTSITIPGSVTSIGHAAFLNCTSLTSINIPNSVISIGESAFKNCSELTDISIPDSVAYIEPMAFNYTGYYNNSYNWKDDALYICNHLITVKTTTSGNYKIADETVCVASVAFMSCANLTSVIIPKSVTSIGRFAFIGCNTLENIVIPDNVKIIGDHAFYNCEGLTSLIISNGLTNISDYTFGNCTGLTKLSIPGSVKGIGEGAFYGCTGLTSITILDSVTSIGNDAFLGCSDDLVIYGYAGSCAQIYAETNEIKFVPIDFEPDATATDTTSTDATETDAPYQGTDIVSRSINLPESGCIVRGNSLTWTVITSSDVSWLKFVGTYPVDGGTEKKLTMLYKAETYLTNPTDTVSITDNGDGTYTWTIKVKFTYSVNMDKIVETWKMYYRLETGTEYFCYEDTEGVEPVVITVGKTTQSLIDPAPNYDKYTLVSASCEAGTEPIAHNTKKNIIIVTTDDCTKVRISVNGKNATYQECSSGTTVTKENGLMTWVISYKFTQTGSNEYKVATRGPAWTENPETFVVVVE